jgi:hypothetical protein
MDPNEALKQLREKAAYALDGNWAVGDMNAVAIDLAEQFQALDEWLRSGGFLPGAWAIPGERG